MQRLIIKRKEKLLREDVNFVLNKCESEKEDFLENEKNFKEDLLRNEITKNLSDMKCNSEKKLLNFKQLPDWLKDNEWITDGHRPPSGSYYECFGSIFNKHTETGNIWTHMLSCLMFLIIAMYFLCFSQYSYKLDSRDKLIFSIYFLSAVLCLGFSFTYHTVSCHSRKVLKLFSKLDYLGINVLISGSFVTGVYFFFYCEKKMQIFYLSMVFIFFTLCSVACLWDKFSEPSYRVFRTSVFLLFGISGILPVSHWLIMQPLSTIFSTKIALFYFVISGILYIIGALLYAGRFPERAFPGQCDYMFQSHQIFHVLVTLAAFSHFLGLIEFTDFIKTNQFCLK